MNSSMRHTSQYHTYEIYITTTKINIITTNLKLIDFAISGFRPSQWLFLTMVLPVCTLLSIIYNQVDVRNPLSPISDKDTHYACHRYLVLPPEACITNLVNKLLGWKSNANFSVIPNNHIIKEVNIHFNSLLASNTCFQTKAWQNTNSFITYVWPIINSNNNAMQSYYNTVYLS